MDRKPERQREQMRLVDFIQLHLDLLTTNIENLIFTCCMFIINYDTY
jgi:hypothetical protein